MTFIGDAPDTRLEAPAAERAVPLQTNTNPSWWIEPAGTGNGEVVVVKYPDDHTRPVAPVVQASTEHWLMMQPLRMSIAEKVLVVFSALFFILFCVASFKFARREVVSGQEIRAMLPTLLAILGLLGSCVAWVDALRARLQLGRANKELALLKAGLTSRPRKYLVLPSWQESLPLVKEGADITFVRDESQKYYKAR